MTTDRDEAVYPQGKPEKNHYTLRELPEEMKPRERLAKWGVNSLSDEELVGLLLSSGSKGVTAVELGREMIRQLGGLKGLRKVSLEQLRCLKGVGLGKASRILAAVELGLRVLQRGETLRPTIKTAESAAAELTPKLRGLSHEEFHVLLLDNKLRVLRDVMVSKGGFDKTVALPREAFHEATKSAARAVIFAHNHPSGDPNPSPDDLLLFKRLNETGQILGIEVLDHLIIGDHGFYSHKSQGRG